MEISDEELMLDFRNGDEKAFDLLYRRYEKPLLNFIYRMTMNAEDAENLFQETFMRMVRAKRKYEATALFKTWFYQIAFNLCCDRVRKMKRRPYISLNAPTVINKKRKVELQEHISNPVEDSGKHVQHHEQEDLLKKAIAHLSVDEHFVVILKEYQEFELSEIAEIMDCPVGTVKSHCHRAKTKLKNILSKYMDD
jgi:RNA polymerase sigma-70 factor (ECF subfamily)